MKYTAVIPVYNSEKIVGQTIDATCAFFAAAGHDYEVILVNDGSRDGSWSVIREKAAEKPEVVAIDLLRNSGQHSAIYCGFEHATGDAVVTLDDDLQNPPQEIAHLIAKMAEGHDVVLGRFKHKRHSSYRRWGSWAIGQINRRIFFQPKDLVMSNFRLIHRDVIDRILAFKTNYPYITGLVLMFAGNPANVLVDHHDRSVGQSNYNMLRIARLVMRILFNYSSYPLRLVATIGIAISAASFLLGLYFLLKSLLGDVQVPGWTTVVVLLSFFNGMTLLLLGMLGEYLIRLIHQTSRETCYHVRSIVGRDGAGGEGDGGASGGASA